MLQKYWLYRQDCMSALSKLISYLIDEEILPSNQQQIIEPAKFTYSPLRKAFEKQTKTIKDQGEKQKKLKKIWVKL